jgi:hypothetical protein
VHHYEHRNPDTMNAPVITKISHPLATIWLAREKHEEACYFYGGTRLIDPSMSDSMATHTLFRLMNSESGTKNRLINRVLQDGALDDLQAELPSGFLQSRVGGARCLIRPRTREITNSLADPMHHRNRYAAAAVLERIGDALNQQEPRIKLTPDFGRYAGLADVLHQYTTNVLGIRCEKGGCGGKSSYSATGVLAGVGIMGSRFVGAGPVTCIGSNGAMGAFVLDHFIERGIANLAACDLAYDAPGRTALPSGCMPLQSRYGCFTGECLARGGLIVATTVGDELERSPWNLLPSGTVLLLAHNLALPQDERGAQLARALAQKRVLVIPGQLLTLGGALTARLEWYWRQLPSNPDFDKQLAHRVVDRVVSYLIRTILNNAQTAAITPFEAMLTFAASEGTVGGAGLLNGHHL